MVVTDSMEGILADGRVMELMRDIEAEDQTLGDRVKQFFRDICDLLKRTIQAYSNVKPDSAEGRMVQGIQEIYDQLQQLFAEGLYEGGDNYRKAEKNTTDDGGVKHSLVVMDNGSVYVKASRNVITGTTKAEQRKNISDFFTTLLEGKDSLDIPTIEGDILTITKAETATKARDDHKTVNGQALPLSDSEFAVKLRIAAHIDEIAEVSKTTKNNKRTSDGKNHSFAKDGFTYRRAYFEDFDGQYYEITISVGHNGTIATVYNVGKVNKSVLPSAKKIAVVGSKPLGKTLSKDSIRNPNEIVKENDSAKSDAVKLSARKGETAEKAISYFGRTYSWKETGYLLTDGAKLDFSGRHEGASGGYRTVDHRDILDVYPEDTELNGNGAMVDFMSQGNIRIMPECNGINLQVQPTKAQEQALGDYISRARGEVILDIDDANGNTVVSVEYPKGTYYSKVLQDIRNYFADGTEPVVSELTKYRFSGRKGEKPDNRMTEADLKAVQSIGRKSVNAFSSADIKATEWFAKQYWKEMGVKSPFFRAWFGDWRENDQTEVRVASQKGDTRGIQKNTDTGWDIQVSAQVFNETKAHNSLTNREA